MKTYAELLEDAKALIESEDAAKIAKLFDDNYNLRAKIRNNKRVYDETIAELKSKVPSETHIVVSKQEYQELSGLKKRIGDDIDNVLRELESIPSLKQELETLKKNDLIAKAALKHGYNVEALTPLMKEYKMVFEDGKFFVSQGDSKKPIADFVAQDLKPFVPSIVGNKSAGRQYPFQAVGDDGNKETDIVADFIEQHTNKE